MASRFLKSRKEGDTLQIMLKKSQFDIPVGPKSIVMIGIGSGVCPFRAILQELVCTGRRNFQTVLLYFGCRSQSEFIYKSEFLSFLKPSSTPIEKYEVQNNLESNSENNKVLDKLYVAFSREQEEVYV